MIYFSIDDENYPYKGVKGRGVARISEDIQKTSAIMEKINMKCLGMLKHPLSKMLMENVRNGTHVAIEIIPKFFSARDSSKAIKHKNDYHFHRALRFSSSVDITICGNEFKLILKAC